MNLDWKSCPKAWKGQYYNPKSIKLATVQVETVSDTNLYCWHVFCGRPGANNDLTVLETSPLILSILNGEREMKLDEGYYINGKLRKWYLYYLTHGNLSQLGYICETKP